MPKTKISEFSATANSNTDINSINIAEGCAPSNINDAIRELMAELKDFQAGTKGDSFNGPVNGTVGATTPASGAFTTLSSTGNTTLGDASGDTVTINGTTTFVNVNPTLSAGTANGVLYLNGSKVATSGSALTFDGSTFTAVGLVDVDGVSGSSLLRLRQTTAGAGTEFNTTITENTGVTFDCTDGGTTARSFIWTQVGSEQMRLTSTGLGIGTTSPDSMCEVNSSNAAYARFKVNYNGSALAYFGSYSGIVGSGNATDVMLSSSNVLAFGSGGTTERMRIDSSGNLLVGTTSQINAGKLCLSINPSSNAGFTTQPTSDNYDAARFNNAAGTQRGSITVSSTATSFNTSSDYRLKEDVQPMAGALARVAQLKPVTYKWKVDGSDGEGFIAHELAEVVPQCVTGEKDAVETYTDEEGNEQTRPVYQGIDTSFLVATLTAAIQELKAEFDAYKATHP